MTWPFKLKFFEELASSPELRIEAQHILSFKVTSQKVTTQKLCATTEIMSKPEHEIVIFFCLTINESL